MSRIAKALSVVILFLLIAGLAVWFGGRSWLAGSVAKYDGELSVEGLGAPVEVSFDARGIPRVRAETDADLFFAIGYLHASERLFQMELVRRLAYGELAEVFGESAYDTDVRQRRLGFGRKAVRDASDLSDEAVASLQSYVDGVNAWMESAEPLPPEFVILRFRPRSWRLEDCLAVALYQSWYSHELMATDQAYETLQRKLGESIASTLQAPYPWSPPTVRHPLGDEIFPLRATDASNAWAISPERSASGHAILAADPHLRINRAPGLWYVASLHSAEGLNATGVMQPGLPLVVMGHNGQIGYAFTVASLDIVDTFEEEMIDGVPARVGTTEGSTVVMTISEQIKVNGETGTRNITVEITPNGPVIEREPGRAVSLHWAGYDFSAADMVQSGLDLMRLTTFDDFRRTVTRFGALDANWIYADRDGNIGSQLGVPIPVRDYVNTFKPQVGRDATASWVGFVPLDYTPHVLNPPEGWVASCNNQIVGSDWPYPMPGFYDPYRITRAAALLGSRNDWSQESVGEMQLDLVSGRAARWKDLAAAAADAASLGDVADALIAWDGAMDPESKEAAIFAIWWQMTGKILFLDELGDDWTSARVIQEHVLSGMAPSLVDDHRTPDVESVSEIASAAMASAVAIVDGRRYGEISTLTISHPLSQSQPVESWLKLSRGPFPIGGDPGSLAANFNRYDEQTSTFRTSAGPSMRFVLDWADVDAFTIDLLLGQSGNPLSPHYDDFLVSASGGPSRWNVPFTRERQEANEASKLRLVP